MNLHRDVLGTGNPDAKILLLVEHPTYEDKCAEKPMQTYAGRMFLGQFHKQGIHPNDIRIEYVCEQIPPDKKFYMLDALTREEWKRDCLERLQHLHPNVIVPLGETALQLTTDRKSIDKWHLSILKDNLGRKCIPILPPERILKNYHELIFVTLGAQRVFEQMQFPEIILPKRELRPIMDVNEALQRLKGLETAKMLSVDIETSRGQIVCIGFADSAHSAISIPTLADPLQPAVFFELWQAIARVLKSESKKIFQNGIYDRTYLSRYGIQVLNFWHDTMIAQKFLNPELPMGLDTLARIYTNEPYWKDDAKDWGVRQDLNSLYVYNAKDCAVTLEIALAQREELQKRRLGKVFEEQCMELTRGMTEMCWNGLGVDEAKREELRAGTGKKLQELQTEFNAEVAKVVDKPVNPRSHSQVKNLFRVLGYAIPKKQGSESSDKESLLKMQLQYPDSKVLPLLVGLSTQQKIISSYLNFTYDTDGRMRYTMSQLGTETGRASCYKDPWDNGMNAQTVPQHLRSMFVASPGMTMIEVDLRQADARVVAWDAPEPTLIQMFLDGEDIHRYVAAQHELFNCALDQVTKPQRQLGKKTGHAANYGMKGHTLATTCLKEMNLVISPQRADKMLEGYHRTFPGIRRWQSRIREEITRTRKMTTPFGWERTFYGRLGDDIFKEAYAHKPQNMVAGTINCLVRYMTGHVRLLIQCHDSVLMEVRDERVNETLDRIKDQAAWNPEFEMLGGKLRIPVEAKIGKSWGNLQEVYSG